MGAFLEKVSRGREGNFLNNNKTCCKIKGALLLPRFYSEEVNTLMNWKIWIVRFPVGKKSLKLNELRIFSDKKGAQSKKIIFTSSYHCGQNWQFFLQKEPFSSTKWREGSSGFCPKLAISVYLTEMANALLKVWDNTWDCGGYNTSFTHFVEVICRINCKKT